MFEDRQRNDTRVERVRAELARFQPAMPELAGLREQFVQHVTQFGEAALDRDGCSDHLTASCVVFDHQLSHVLLHHHRKAGLWGHFGGHIEPTDASLAQAAIRECVEESGLGPKRWFSARPVDLDHHQLPAQFGRCRSHLDVVYAATAQRTESVTVSAEGLGVQWFPLSELPTTLMPDLWSRLPRIAQVVSAQPR